MSVANLADSLAKNFKVTEQLRLGVQTRTMAGTVVLTVASPPIQLLDPGGAARNLDLPAEADSEGLVFLISNEADAAEVITVRNDGGGTVCTPAQNEAAIVFCDGTTWTGLVGATS